MISVKCTYADGNTINTDINCDLDEAKKYFIGHCFNLGVGENDNMQKCVAVEEIKQPADDHYHLNYFNSEKDEVTNESLQEC